MAAQGLSKEFICRILQIHRRTFETKAEFHADIDQLIAEGVAMGANIAGKSLMKKVREGDLGAIKWFETSRSYRRPDAQYIDLSASLTERAITPEAVDVRLKELEAKLNGLKS